MKTSFSSATSLPLEARQMNTYSKFPILFMFLGISLAGVLIFEFGLPKTEADSIPVNPPDVLIRDQIALLGGNALISTSDPSGPEPKVVQKLPVVVTAYSSSVWETDDSPFITASGAQVRDGIIANNYLPFGTKVRMPEIYGEKVFIVEDRMSWKKGNYQIDIWFSSHIEAENFGAKRTYIEILES